MLATAAADNQDLHGETRMKWLVAEMAHPVNTMAMPCSSLPRSLRRRGANRPAE